MRDNLRRVGIPVVLVLALAGCARPSPTSSGFGHGSRSGDLILKVEVGGGFLAPQAQLGQMASFALYGDGRLVVPGPVTEIYPGRALPNLQVRTISEAGIQAIIAAAKAAGLLGPDRNYNTIRIADAPTTTFTVVVDGLRHVVSVQALGMGEPSSGATPDEVQARAKLAALQSKLTDLATWLPAGSLGAEASFRTDEMRVYVLPYQPVENLPEKSVNWPLGSFHSFGPLSGNAQTRCGTVAGKDLGAVLTAAGTANELTPWKADGSRWGLVFRPLLPDESGCA